MKELSNEELILGIEDIVRVSTARKAEILSRFDRGQRAVNIIKELVETSNAMPPPSGDPRNVFGQSVGDVKQWRVSMENAWNKARLLLAEHTQEAEHD